MNAALFWFRQDLRLFDNPGLKAAASARKPLVLLYLRDATTPVDERMGAASDWCCTILSRLWRAIFRSAAAVWFCAAERHSTSS